MKKEVFEDDDLMVIVLSVPKQSVKIKIDSTLIDDETDELYHAENIMNLADLTEARITGYEWESENVKYVLSDEYREG